MNLATPCSLCGEPIEGLVRMSEIFNGPVCGECAKCCADAEAQSQHYGKRAGIVGTMTTEQHKQLRQP